MKNNEVITNPSFLIYIHIISYHANNKLILQLNQVFNIDIIQLMKKIYSILLLKIRIKNLKEIYNIKHIHISKIFIKKY